MIRHFLFTDYVTDEDFIVGANTLPEATLLASRWFGDPSYICELTEMEAEASGLDEY